MNLSDFISLFRVREPEHLPTEPSAVKLYLWLWFVTQMLVSLLLVFKLQDVLQFLRSLLP